MNEVNDALEMIDAFTSVSVQQFDLSVVQWRNSVPGMQGLRLPAASIRFRIPSTLLEARLNRYDVIIRPRQASGAVCVQLDDLDAWKLATVAPRAFLAIETSPGSYQAWISVLNAGEDLARRLQSGCGADTRATGASRIAGSRNYKPEYAPDFPLVRIEQHAPRLQVEAAELEAAGLVAPPLRALEPILPARHVASSNRADDGWPDYERVLSRCPYRNRTGDGPDRSKVDAMWCKWAAERGHSTDAIANRLSELSPKVAEADPGYALRTARWGTDHAFGRNFR